MENISKKDKIIKIDSITKINFDVYKSFCFFGIDFNIKKLKYNSCIITQHSQLIEMVNNILTNVCLDLLTGPKIRSSYLKNIIIPSLKIELNKDNYISEILIDEEYKPPHNKTIKYENVLSDKIKKDEFFLSELIRAYVNYSFSFSIPLYGFDDSPKILKCAIKEYLIKINNKNINNNEDLYNLKLGLIEYTYAFNPIMFLESLII